MKILGETILFDISFFVILYFLVSGCAPFPSAPVIDQSQFFFNTNEDWPAGTGQIFEAGKSGLLVGVMMAATRHGGPRDLGIELRRVDSEGKPSDEVLARGIIAGEKFREDQACWQTIYFDKPYPQKRGEKLVWVVSEAPKVKPHGWHNLSFQGKDPYKAGYMYFKGWLHRGGTRTTYKDQKYDMAFVTLVIPNFDPLKYWWFSRENQKTVLKRLSGEVP